MNRFSNYIGSLTEDTRTAGSTGYIQADQYFKDPKKAAEFVVKNLGKRITLNGEAYALETYVSIYNRNGTFELIADVYGNIRILFKINFLTNKIEYEKITISKTIGGNPVGRR